ncbi:HSPG2 isoform 10, partial [Pan troglodytes]
GTPPLTFQWSRVGSSLPGRATARNELLHFERAAPEDSGRYRCRVTNKVGSAEAFAQLLVQESRTWTRAAKGRIYARPMDLGGRPRPVPSWLSKVGGWLQASAKSREQR